MLLLLLSGFTLYLDFRVRDAFEGRRFALPARLYARPLELFPGLKLTPDALTQELVRLGYKEPLTGEEPGRFARQREFVRDRGAAVCVLGWRAAGAHIAPRFSWRDA